MADADPALPLAPAPAPPVLTFAALKWTSETGPTHVFNLAINQFADVVGTYDVAIPSSSFDLLNVRRKDTTVPFVYVPRRGRGTNSMTFRYERKSFKNYSCECCPDNVQHPGAEVYQGPRFALVTPGREPLPYQLPRGMYDAIVGRRQAGPPFIFTKEDSDGPEGILSNTLLLDSPDLPGQDELAPWADTDLEWIPEDPESTMRFYEGWRGLWADKLMAKSDKRRPLGQVTITQWTTRLGRKQWAVVLKLKAKRLETYIPTMNYPGHPAMQRMGPPKRCISQYEIEATVLRIFVTQTLIDSGELDRLVIVPAYSNNSVASTENEAPPSPGSIVYFDEL